MTVNTRVIKLFLTGHTADYVPLPNGLRLQVLPSISYLPRCQKHHFGAFIQDQQILVVWDDQPKELLIRAEHIEADLMEMIWNEEYEEDFLDEKQTDPYVATTEISGNSISPSDLEAALEAEKRPTLLLNPMMVAATIALLISALSLGFRNLASEIAVDGNYTRLALLAAVPPQVFVSLVSIINSFDLQIPTNS